MKPISMYIDLQKKNFSILILGGFFVFWFVFFWGGGFLRHGLTEPWLA